MVHQDQPNHEPYMTHNIVLLVSAVYTCDSGHKLPAHDATILKRFPAYQMIPFILLSRTGFITDLVNLCTTFCTHGMNFYTIETFLSERKLDVFARWQCMHKTHHKLMREHVQICNYQMEANLKSPSDDIIAKMVLVTFLKDEKTYLAEMNTVPVG